MVAAEMEAGRISAGDPLVSVCVPTKDRLPFLHKSLPGALAQAYEPYEVIVSDNWSTDGTREFCLDVARKDPRLRYVRPARPLGHFANHNSAYREARGRYISFFHDDDLYRPQLLALFVRFLETHPTVGIVSSDWDRVDENDRPLSPRVHRVPAVSRGIDYIERTLRSGRSMIALPCCMIRRESLPEPPFEEGEPPVGFTDHVTWLRIAERWDIGHVPERLFAYRQHAGAGSRKRIGAIVDDYTTTFTDFVDDHLRRHPEAADRARRWREAIRRYAFWAMIYDLAGEELEPSETDATLRRLRSLATGPAQRSVLAVVRAMIGRGGRPLVLLARNSELARRILRID